MAQATDEKQVKAEVVEILTGEVVDTMGPMSPRKYERLERGLLMRIDTDRFFVRDVEVS